jgi:hypothetical protein
MARVVHIGINIVFDEVKKSCDHRLKNSPKSPLMTFTTR